MDDQRIMQRTIHLHVNSADVVPEVINRVEGVEEQGHVTVRKMAVGEHILFLEVFRKKGLIDPVHKHMDHETVAYLISGKMRLVIGGEEFIATAGSSWVHPVGVEHYSEALEDCLQVEVKSPPRKTWE
ncbi:cupin domain-containing protein [Tistrella mobilis]|uniref:cupin domain-containing protein n=1 Tax=Tistrella mobilis TaxID=171437 RepID=UPI0031F7014F